MAIIHTTCNMTTYPSRAGGIVIRFSIYGEVDAYVHEEPAPL